MVAIKTTTPGLMTAGYIRLTRDESLANGLSAPAQRKGINEYAKRAGLDPAVLFEETKAVAGDSAFDSRPAGRKLVEAIKSGEVGHLIVRDLDRLTRDILLSVEVMDLCRTYRVQIHTFSGPILLKSASDRFAYNVRSAASMFEKDQVSDRVIKAKRESVEQGRHAGGPGSYGYVTQVSYRTMLLKSGTPSEASSIKASTEYPVPGKLYVYEPEAKILRLIIELSLQGYGSRRLINELNTRGHRTRTGAFWSTERLKRTLENPAMAGYLTYDVNKEETGRTTPKHRQKLFKGQHEAIIPLEDWKKVRAMRQANTEKMNDLTPRKQQRTYFLTGLLRCECGAPMRGKSSSKRHLKGWYVCMKRFYYGPKSINGCGLAGSSLNAGRVHEAFWKQLKDMVSGPDLTDRVYAATLKIVAEQNAGKSKAVNYGQAIEKIEKQIQTWYDRHDASTADEAREASWQRILDLTRQKKALDHERQQLSKLPDVTRITREQVANYLGSMFKLIDQHSPAEGKAFVQSLAQHHGLRVEVTGPNAIGITLGVKSPGTVSDNVVQLTTEAVLPEKLRSAKGDKWLAAHQGKHKCEGCGKVITVVRHHLWTGIPKHHPKCWTRELARRRNHRDDGLLTGAAVGRLLGVGDSTITRWRQSGKLPTPLKGDRGTWLWDRSQVAHLL